MLTFWVLRDSRQNINAKSGDFEPYAHYDIWEVNKFLRSLFSLYGLTHILVSDMQCQFTLTELWKFMNDNGTKPLTIQVLAVDKQTLWAAHQETSTLQILFNMFFLPYSHATHLWLVNNLHCCSFGRPLRKRLDVMQPNAKMHITEKLHQQM